MQQQNWLINAYCLLLTANGGDNICEELKDEVIIGLFRWSWWDVSGMSEDLTGVFAALARKSRSFFLYKESAVT